MSSLWELGNNEKQAEELLVSLCHTNEMIGTVYFVILLSSKSIIKHSHLYSYAILADGVTKYIMGQGSGKKRENKENEQLFAKRDVVKNTQCSLDHEVMKETLPGFFFLCKIL